MTTFDAFQVAEVDRSPDAALALFGGQSVRGAVRFAASPPTTFATGTECWVQNASAQDVLEMQWDDQTISHSVYFAAGASIPLGVKLIVAGGAFAGDELRVKSYVEKSVGLEYVWVAFCEEDIPEPTSFS